MKRNWKAMTMLGVLGLVTGACGAGSVDAENAANLESLSSGKVKKAKETVTCLFNSGDREECYSEFGSCVGIDSCEIKVKGAAGTEITWKSSCGDYRYTTLDGIDEQIDWVCTQ
jgi:hypothetical protein